MAFLLIGRRRAYFKKYPLEDLDPEDKRLFPVEKAYKDMWEARQAPRTWPSGPSGYEWSHFPGPEHHVDRGGHLRDLQTTATRHYVSSVREEPRSAELLDLCTAYPRHQAHILSQLSPRSSFISIAFQLL